MKANNANIKAALAKASLAEQEEIGKNYKRAFDLYKEAVEILMPIAEGTVYVQVLKALKKIFIESTSLVEKRVIKSEVCD